VAQYADACNLLDTGAEGLRQKIEMLEGHCAAWCDPAEIEQTVLVGEDPLADVDALLREAEECAPLASVASGLAGTAPSRLPSPPRRRGGWCRGLRAACAASRT